MMVLTVFVAQLFRVQGIDAASVAQQAFSERAQKQTIPAKRGDIVDANGVVLARSVERRNVTADPLAASTYKVKDPITKKSRVVGLQGVADAIAPIVGGDSAQMLTALQQTYDKKRRFMYLIKDISPEQWNKISDLRIPGIFSERTVKREYPQGTSVAPLIGWVNGDGSPGGGVELQEQSELNGTPGVHLYERAPDGTVIATANNSDTPAADGKGVELTIDNDLQWQAQNLISSAVQKTGALSGDAVVMDTKGNLLAVASAPSFDNNSMSTASGSTLLSRPFSEAYEPGSTSKVVTMSAALQEGIATPSTQVEVPNRLPRAGKNFKDSEEHATEYLTVAGVLAKSSNIGTIKIGEKLPPQTLSQYMAKFGLGKATGVNFPGEQRGIIKPFQKWTGSTRYTVLFGQGLSSTAIQQLGVFQTIANGGVREPIKLVKGIQNSDGGYSPPTDTRTPQRVVSTTVASEITKMMQGVIDDRGTAKKAAVPGYNVAGKTGTAERYDEKLGRYDGYTASFIGFAPAEKPRYVISVVLQRPKTSIYGGEVAAPVFSQLMLAALQRGKVPPSTTKPALYDLTYDPSKGSK